MNSKALSPPLDDKTAIFVCGAFHPATPAARVPSLSLSSLATASLFTALYLHTSLCLQHGDDMEWVPLPLY